MSDEDRVFLEGVEGRDSLIEKGIDTDAKLLEAYNQMGSQIRNRVEPLAKDASSEDLHKFRVKIGLIDPESPSYTVPEDIDEAGRERVMEMTQMLPEGSMTDAEYREWAHKLASRESVTRQQAITQAREAMSKQADESREEHGTDAMVATEQFMEEQFGGDPDLLAAMKKQAKHPRVVEAFSTLVEAMKEKPMPQHEPNLKPPATTLTIPQMGHELSGLQDITNKPDFKKADPANSELLAKQDRLFKIMHEKGLRSAAEMIRYRG